MLDRFMNLHKYVDSLTIKVGTEKFGFKNWNLSFQSLTHKQVWLILFYQFFPV